MTNPRVTFGSCFIDFFLVNRGYDASKSTRHLWKVFQWRFPKEHRLRLRWLFLSQLGLRALPNPRVTFGSCFVDFSESTGAVWADESILHLWKQFRGLFLSAFRLNFPWLFMSPQRLCGLTNPFVTSENSFGGYFRVGSDSVFLESFWVNMGCVGWRIYGSPVKAVLGAVYEWAATHFSLTVYESTGAVWSDESIRHLWTISGAIFEWATT